MKNLAKAVLNVMKDVKSIDKSMNVGSGNSSYKGVADKDVKQIIGKSMEENGLVILPIEVEPTTQVARWEEETQWGKKQKQSVFTEVKTKYLLLHESGESQVLSGYGHGVDSQDKGAGKATTYALKYALLYAFLVPTGKIDDADTTNSNDITPPPPTSNKTTPNKTTPNRELKELKVMDKDKNFTKEWKNILDAIENGKIKSVADVRKHYKVSKEVEEKINNVLNFK